MWASSSWRSALAGVLLLATAAGAQITNPGRTLRNNFTLLDGIV